MLNLENPPFIHTKFDCTPPGRNGVEGWFADHDGIRVVFFRGADGLQDAKACLSFGKKKPYWSKLKELKIHKGFLEYANQAWDELDSLGGLPKDDSPILFLGHSMGGAIAAITAFRYSCQYRKAYVSCRAYGPADVVGNNVFRDYFTAFVNDRRCFYVGADPLPLVRKISWFFGFRHVYRPDHYSSPYSYNFFKRIYLDHQMPAYIKRLDFKY